MTAFRFRLDANGYVCNGTADMHSRSDETWRPPKDVHGISGITIQWPSEPWDHIATQNGIDYDQHGLPQWAPTNQEKAA